MRDNIKPRDSGPDTTDSLVDNHTPDGVIIDHSEPTIPISDAAPGLPDLIADVQEPSVEKNRMRLDPKSEGQIDRQVDQRPREDFEIKWIAEDDLPKEEKHRAGFQAVDENGHIIHTGMTLRQLEQIQGQADEKFRQTEKSLRDHKVREKGKMEPRAAACAEDASSDTYYDRTTLEERPEQTTPTENPWTSLSQDQVASVNQYAAKLAEHYKNEPVKMGRATMSKCLARKVRRGAGIASAFFELKHTIEKFPGVKQQISDIDPFNQYQATVEVEVTQLWYPKSKTQRQVGIVSDGTETMKLVIWQKSGRKPLLRKGDVIHITKGKVNAFKAGGEWKKSIAIDSEAEIHHVEHGDGQSPARQKSRNDATYDPWDANSRAHRWHDGMDRSKIESPNIGITPEKTEALNEWIRGNLTYEEVDEHAEKLQVQ